MRRAIFFCGALGGLAGCGLFAGDAPAASDASVTVEEPATQDPIASILGQLMGSPSASIGEGTDAPVVRLDTEVNADDALPVIPETEASGGFWSLFGGLGLGRDTSAPDSVSVPPSGLLAYGEIATVCGLSSRDLGRAVESKSGYTVYDTAPGTTAPRTHFITGFSDGCARQITAALTIFGDIGTHEIVRYSAADGGLEYTETDNAYEAIKADFCGVRTGQPCGARLERLARRTTFLTVYERFGSNPVWADILLHNGEVVAMDFKGD